VVLRCTANRRLNNIAILQQTRMCSSDVPEPKPKIKRFYNKVTISAGAPWQVLLDGRAVKTNKKTPLFVPNVAIATMMAAEWDMAEDIVLKYMPMTNMGCIALDRVANDRQYMEEQLLKFIQTDTICYRLNSSATENLYAKQLQVWDPLNDWFAENFGGEKLAVTTGLGVSTQPEAATVAVQAYIESLCPWRLAAIDTIVATTKSIVIALALAHGHINALEAVVASRLEEDFQAELFGFVEGGHDWDVATCKIRLTSAALVFQTIEMEQSGELDSWVDVLSSESKIIS